MPDLALSPCTKAIVRVQPAPFADHSEPDRASLITS